MKSKESTDTREQGSYRKEWGGGLSPNTDRPQRQDSNSPASGCARSPELDGTPSLRGLIVKTLEWTVLGCVAPTLPARQGDTPPSWKEQEEPQSVDIC